MIRLKKVSKMKFDLKFSELNNGFDLDFGETSHITDGGYDKGYAEGFETGQADGYSSGYADGLAARTYETWTITLTDGTIVEKEVALL